MPDVQSSYESRHSYEFRRLKFVASNSLTHTKDVTRARVRSVLPLIKLESATVAVLFKDLTNVILK